MYFSHTEMMFRGKWFRAGLILTGHFTMLNTRLLHHGPKSLYTPGITSVSQAVRRGGWSKRRAYLSPMDTSLKPTISLQVAFPVQNLVT